MRIIFRPDTDPASVHTLTRLRCVCKSVRLHELQDVTQVLSANKEPSVGLLREESAHRPSYHDEAGGDGVVAAVAQLPELGPVIVLAVKPPILLIIPVRQRGAALITPER